MFKVQLNANLWKEQRSYCNLENMRNNSTHCEMTTIRDNSEMNTHLLYDSGGDEGLLQRIVLAISNCKLTSYSQLFNICARCKLLNKKIQLNFNHQPQLLDFYLLSSIFCFLVVFVYIRLNFIFQAAAGGKFNTTNVIAIHFQNGSSKLQLYYNYNYLNF